MIAVLVALMLSPAAHAADLPGTLQELGHDDLGARGLNSALALADHCAYVGSRGQGPIVIEDVSDPAHPHGAGSLPRRAWPARGPPRPASCTPSPSAWTATGPTSRSGRAACSWPTPPSSRPARPTRSSR